MMATVVLDTLIPLKQLQMSHDAIFIYFPRAKGTMLITDEVAL